MADRISTSRFGRTAKIARLGARVGGRYASTAARKAFASSERRIELDDERQLRTAEAVAAELGNMKGALMKLGQMASYLDGGLPEPMRVALSQLQAGAPPMSSELAASVVREQLGADPSDIFVEWDPQPLAAASIGQVHRALLYDERIGDEVAVAVKVQYPGVGEAITSDLANVNLLAALLKQGFSGFEPEEMVTELRARVIEELDYTNEARNQTEFVDFYDGHPFISVPPVLPEYSTDKVLTTQLDDGVPWAEMMTWGHDQRNLAGETIFRFVFRSLYRLEAFNGDPHPGNYLFKPDGRVTFLDFGLVKHFAHSEMDTFARMVKAAALDQDMDEFRAAIEHAGLLAPNAPVSTREIGEYYSKFYHAVREDRTMTWTPEYASDIVRHVFDRHSPIAQYSTVPKAFVFIQRINLGLYAILGELGATANWRRISGELWPFTNSEPSTPLGELEAAWLAEKSSTG